MKINRGSVSLPGTSLDYKTGSWRVQKPVFRHLSAPCHQACPAGEDAQAYLALVEEGNLQLAWQSLVQANPLPAITGRVCHHPCEQSCNRGQLDEPIAIHSVERFLGDQAIANGWAYPDMPTAGEKVAIVGAGPAGLSAAYHCARLGLSPVLFDALPEAGGLLRAAIPAYRLPRSVLDQEIERLLALNIDFKSHHKLGRDMSLAELQQDYKAVFCGPGKQIAQPWDVDGATPTDLHQGLDLLREWMDVGNIPITKSAAVVGAGNTAVDLARILKRAGVETVHIISHKVRSGPNVAPEDTMPAIAREIDQAIEEGITLHEHRGVRRLILRGEHLTGIEMIHMKKMPQAPSGKLKRVAFEGTETVLKVDQIYPAVGQIMDVTGFEAVVNQWHGLTVDTNRQIKHDSPVFAGGDATGHGTVTEAIGDGRVAALGMLATVKQQPITPHEAAPVAEYEALNQHYFAPAKRVHSAVVPVQERDATTEIEASLSDHQVHQEATRCFSCGQCMSCDNCWQYCPDASVLKQTRTSPSEPGYVIDYDYCKGCGLCAAECPCGYIDMVEDL